MTRNERFNRSMKSLEAMVDGISDTSKARIFSDCGKGVRKALEELDHDPQKESKSEVEVGQRRNELLFEAEMRLVEAGLKHLIPVLLLIVENGANREESLWKVPRATYFRHRDALLKFFL